MLTKITKLKGNPSNPRVLRDDKFAKLKKSIEEFPDMLNKRPIVAVTDKDGKLMVLGGNMRLRACQELGLKEVPVILADDWTEEQRREFIIKDNVGFGEWDWDALGNEWDAGQLTEWGLDVPEDFSEEKADVVEDEVPEPPVDPITKPGDLWLLGDHRLLCGDSTKAEDVERLMAGAKADLCFTSPPYALGKSVALSGNKKMAAKANAYDDHEDNAAEWAGLMSAWFGTSDRAVSDAWVVNVQPLAGNKRDLVRFIADNAGRLVDVATWDKGHAAPQMAAGVMASRYEWMIIFAASDGASRAVPLSSWRGTVQSVYVAPPQRGNEFSDIHAATMPLHVPAWVMQTLCDQSKSVYEPFCGTGTTLVAAEQLGRKCYGMEISPQYCDVIVKRWETLTGKKAIHQATGKTFNEMAETGTKQGTDADAA